MKIVKNKDLITVEHNGEEVHFKGFPTPRKRGGQNSPKVRYENGVQLTPDVLIFSELNRYWATLNESACEELFNAYQLLQELGSEEDSTIAEHIPSVIEVIAKHHPASVFKNMYPVDKVFIPNKLRDSFTDMSPNYTQMMTYLSADYYELIILTLLTKPFLPVFGTLGVYVGGKGLPQELKRKIVYKINQAYELFSTAGLDIDSPTRKLEQFLESLVEKFQKECAGKGNGMSLSVLAAVMGYGSDMMDEYLVALTVVRYLAIRACYCDYPDGSFEDSSLVSSIYFGVRGEVESGFAGRVSGKSVVMKPHPTAVVFNGEKGKVSSIDLVQGRSSAPIKEYVRTGIAFKDYRRFIKNTGYDIPPSQVKTLFDSVEEHHTGPTYELHEWLVAAALHRYADRRTYKDVDSDKFLYGMALAQSIYIYYGMYDLARLLSCEMKPGNISGYPFEPVSSEMKISVDRYYPQAYRAIRNQEPQNVPAGSIEILIRNHLNPYTFHFKASPAAAEILKCAEDVPAFRPGINIVAQLTEFLGIQARQKVNEVNWFNS